MKLLRVEIRWNKVLSPEQFRAEKFKSCTVQFQQNKYNPSLAWSLFTKVKQEDARNVMTQLQHMISGRAASLKMYYQADTLCCKNNLLPINMLEKLGFVYKEPFYWVFNDHPDFSIAAMGIPSFSDSHWVLQIDKRNGDGVPPSACEYSNMFQRQLSLFEEEEMVS
ncbi:hypothetical protein AM501_24000 [Aneurinibacillus migulanus]|uniref:hypothetical protein n=1 Tax=Aneurinibacillus migulanus TaxID=47500 RepID=UPI0005BD1F76|nr:hypothetical protein [Aneurinibacillus migulanus]KIV58928.1 hypothetical protein TS64_03980 [Aneurinibacillus migulanus]KPD05840.1 hypothetical protein AM501_24000 [Aneurinibacillus migulanus]